MPETKVWLNLLPSGKENDDRCTVKYKLNSLGAYLMWGEPDGWLR